VVEYGVSDIPEFEEYQTIYDEAIGDHQEFLASEDDINSTPTENERYEDNIFRRGLRTIRLTYKSIGIMSRSIAQTQQESRLFAIPNEVVIMVTIIIGLTIMFLVFKAYWRFKDV
jgi:hypothetical protein